MILNGGCFCGAIRYEASGEIFHKTICHCGDCRRTSGAPNVGWFSLRVSGYRLLKGAPLRFHSSRHVTRTFCGNCGTQLSYEHEDMPGDIDITIGSLDAPDDVAPDDHTFTAYRLAWDKSADGLPEYLRTRAEG
jgi:hypothetical protein